VTARTHQCPAPHCKAEITASKLMCADDWAQVPKPLQQEVYSAWDHGKGRGTLRHLRAVRAAIEAVT
jgi:hypothetical protein